MKTLYKKSSLGIFRRLRKYFRKYFGKELYFLQEKIISKPKASTKFYNLFSMDCINSSEDLKKVAHNIVNGNYSFLGNNIYSQPFPNWHKDYQSGFTWPLISYNKIWDHTPEKVDLKYPWELSSLFHLFPIATAYAMTREKKLCDFYLSHLNHWMESNPCPYGVNWCNPMVVSLRLIILIETSSLFNGAFSVENRESIEMGIWQHLLFIVNNLENLGISPANHYLTEIVGVLWGAMYFDESNLLIRLLRKWVLHTLDHEMMRQVFPDGMSFEGSVSYHRLVTELLLYSAILLNKNRQKLSVAYSERLHRMLQAQCLFTLPSNLYPHIGDNDDCRLFYGSDYYTWNKRDARYLLAIGAVFINDSDLLPKQKDTHELATWIFGNNKVDQLAQKTPRPKQGLFALDSSQFYFIRNDEDCLVVNCSRPSHPEYGHTHNDTLSFVLCLKGREVFVDPGSYVYTRDKKMRNLFRSTRYHNTLQVNNEEQWPFSEDSLFLIPKGTPPKALQWGSSNKEYVFTGEHYGYTRMPGNIVHRRTFRVEKETFTVILRDDLYYRRVNEVTVNRLQLNTMFHLAYGVKCYFEKGAVILSVNNNAPPLFALYFTPENDLSVCLEDAWFSPSYGVKLPSKILIFKKLSSIPFSFEYTIKKL